VSQLALTLDGLRELIRDLRAQGMSPGAILVSEADRLDLLEDLFSFAGQVNEIERKSGKIPPGTIGFIEGCIIHSHPDIERGKARIIPRADPLNQAQHIMVR